MLASKSPRGWPGARRARFGVPMTPRGSPARFVVLGLGKLGGGELNYSSDIDLIFLFDDEGQTTGPKVVSNAELFARGWGARSSGCWRSTPRWEWPIASTCGLRFPRGGGAMARSLGSTLGYYVTRGRDLGAA